MSFGFVAASGRSRRESAIREVMAGVSRHWFRTSLPMKPVLPKRMTFILVDVRLNKNECLDDNERLMEDMGG